MADLEDVDEQRAERRRLVVARDRFERERAFLEHERVRLLAELAALRVPDENMRRERAEAIAALAQRADELARERAAHALARDELARAQALAEATQRALDDANQTLRAIDASITFRAARPLHRVVNRLRALAKPAR